MQTPDIAIEQEVEQVEGKQTNSYSNQAEYWTCAYERVVS